MNGPAGDAWLLPAASRFVIPQGRLGAGQPNTMTSSYDSSNFMQQVFYKNNKKKTWMVDQALSLSVSLTLQCGNMATRCSKRKNTSSHPVTLAVSQHFCAASSEAL
jgi:hypothetical protein